MRNMLQNIKELQGDALAAVDGDIGHVRDFYFDDKKWVIRYVIADTGSWLPGRLVLLATNAFGKWDRYEKKLHLKLRKKQILDSPSIDSHEPVSSQFETDYYRHYGWPVYWDEDGISGVDGNRGGRSQHRLRADKHLQSVLSVTGYPIQAADGKIGHVSSFLVDDRTWTVGDLLVETGNWHSGKEILIPSRMVERISYEDSTVFVNLTKAEILKTAERDPPWAKILSPKVS
jgi:uncharacterized protein YrrD